MFCNNCGKELTETTAFCPHCGSSLSDNSMKVGTITFFREKAGTAKLVPAKIKIDGQLRGELKQNSSCSALLPMGTHSVEIRASINPIAKYSITIDSSEPNPFFSFKIGISGTAILTPQSRGNFINQTKKTGTLSMIVSLLLTFIVLVCVFALFPDSSKDNPDKANTKDAEVIYNSSSFETTSGTVGPWEITVNDYSFSQSVSVGLLHEYRAEDNSKYCVINITVKNIGREPDVFLPWIPYGDTASVKIMWNELEYIRSELAFVKDTLSEENLNPLVATTGTLIFELPNEVIESDTPPTIIFSTKKESFSCELKKE